MNADLHVPKNRRPESKPKWLSKTDLYTEAGSLQACLSRSRFCKEHPAVPTDRECSRTLLAALWASDVWHRFAAGRLDVVADDFNAAIQVSLIHDAECRSDLGK